MKATIIGNNICYTAANLKIAVKLPVDICGKFMNVESSRRTHNCADDFDVELTEKVIYKIKDIEGFTTRYKGRVNVRFVFNRDGLHAILNAKGLQGLRAGGSCTCGSSILVLHVPHRKVMRYINNLKTFQKQLEVFQKQLEVSA